MCAYDRHPDLQRTTAKGPWWMGRTLLMRLHLRALVLQWQYTLTDRQGKWVSLESDVV